MDALALGKYPSFNYLGEEFSGADEGRELLKGKSLGAKFVIIFLKGDWAEFSSTLGFPTFAHTYFSCPLCCAPREGLHCRDEWHRRSMPYEKRTHVMMDMACTAAEINVSINNAHEHSMIRRNLRYSREAGKKKDLFGRCLSSVEGIDFAPLAVGDRLEPSRSCTDIGSSFDNCKDYPLHVTFWRESSQSWS